MLHSNEFHSSFCLPLTWSMCSTKCLSTSLTVEFSSVQSKHIHALLPFANQSFRVFSIVGTTALHNCSGTEFFLATKQRIIVSVCLISATAWPASSAWLVARVLVWPVLFARSCLSLLHSSVVCISHSIIIQPALVFVLFPHQSSFSLHSNRTQNMFLTWHTKL